MIMQTGSSADLEQSEQPGGRSARWLALRPRAIRILLPFAAGALSVAAMPPWNIWPAMFVGFSTLYFITMAVERPRSAFFAGWLFGFGFHVFGLAWTANALTVEGSTFSWVIPFAIGGLPALLAVFPAIACMLARRYLHLSGLAGFFGFAGLFTLMEWSRGHVFTGFPWNLPAYGWTGLWPVAQSAALIGAYGLSFLTVLWAATPGFLAVTQSRRIVAGILSLATLCMIYGWGAQRLATNPTRFNPSIALRIVQPSIPQNMKWDPEEAARNLEKTVNLSLPDTEKTGAATTTLLIWPETASSEKILARADVRTAMSDILRLYEGDVFFITGMLRYETAPEGNRYYNSLGVYDREMNLMGTYDKSHLVPFGEYIPLSRFLPSTPLVSLDGFQAGGGATLLGIPAKSGAIHFSPMICYEVIFPAAIVNASMARPALLLNVTNDGWYGRSAGPYQHFAITRFRAVEEGIPLARAANTGISAVIDAYGRTIWYAPLYAETASNVKLPVSTEGSTLYARTGDGPTLIVCLLGSLAGLLACRKARASRADPNASMSEKYNTYG